MVGGGASAPSRRAKLKSKTANRSMAPALPRRAPAPHKHHYFHFIPIIQSCLRPVRAPHDDPIVLNRDAIQCDLQVLEQTFQIQSGGQFPPLTV